MRKILPLILLFFISCNEKESNFNTKVFGIVENVKDSTKIQLTDFYFGDVGGYLDSTYVINNKFTFEFNLNEPRHFYLNGLGTTVKHLAISPGDTELLITDYDSIHRLEIVKGSPETFENEEYYKKYGYENDMEYLKNNPNNFASLNILWEDRYKLSTTDLESHYNTLTEKWKNHTIAKDIEDLLSLNYNPEIGAHFLDFELKDKNDNIISLSNFKGKNLLIEFTATWCGPCIAQIPFQKSAYEKYKDKDFEILHIYLEDKETMIRNINKHEIPWNAVYAPKKFRASIAMNNRVYYLPNMFLLDKEHKIIGTTLNPVLMFEDLEKVLEEKIK